MKALVLTGVKEFEIQDLPTPEIQPNEVLINTAYAGVCGTDHDLYAGRPGSAAAVPPIAAAAADHPGVLPSPMVGTAYLAADIKGDVLRLEGVFADGQFPGLELGHRGPCRGGFGLC